MRRTVFLFGVFLCAAALLFFLNNRLPRTVSASAIVLSTGAINNYGGNGDLHQDIAEANDFRAWYLAAGNSVFTAWTDGNVWGSDFRDQGSPNDMDPSGGSDRAQVYYYTGHGSCPASQTTTSQVDFFTAILDCRTPRTFRPPLSGATTADGFNSCSLTPAARPNSLKSPNSSPSSAGCT
jgi:hypothetical protein